MKYQFITKMSEQYPVKVLCRILDVSRSGYYAWCIRKPSAREMAAEVMIKHIRRVHQMSHRTYGSLRIHAQLKQEGIACGHNRIARLMHKEEIFGQRKYRKITTTNSKHTYPIAFNILNRQFHADQPNEKWVTDITYIHTLEGWLYYAGILDLFSRKLVGWEMAAQMTTDLVERALRMALYQRQPPKGLLIHSDRGSQYASNQIRRILASNQIVVSMSRTGNCYDNAVMESFFSTLKCEWVDFQKYTSRIQARKDIFAYTEGFYNTVRLHSSLGYLSPVMFEEKYYQSP